MGIGKILQKWRNRKEEFKEMQRQDRMSEVLQQRKKNANERELERYIEEERQKKIKTDLDSFRAMRRREYQEATTLKGKNIFKGHKSILDQDKSVLTDNKKLFNGKATMLKSGVRLR